MPYAPWKNPNRILRWNVIPFVAAAFIGTFGVAVLGYYTLDWQASLNSYQIWLEIAFGFLCFGVFFTGLDAQLQNESPYLATSTGTFPMGAYVEMPVAGHFYDIVPEVVRRVTGQRSIPVQKPETTGKDSKGRIVPVTVIPLGGRDAYGISIDPGGRGFLVNRGDSMIPLGDIHRGQCYFTPRVLRQLDYSQISEEVYETLKGHNKFVPYKSPIFELGYWDPNFVAWCRRHAAEMRIIIEGAEPNSIYGFSDPTYWQTMYFSAISELNTLRHGRRRHLDAIQSNDEALAGQAERRAAAYRSPGPQEPVVLEGARRPRDET